MNRRVYPVFALVVALGLLTLPGCLAAAADSDMEARKAKIAENLKAAYPQLQTAGIVMDDLVASEFEGLFEGSFTIGGKQTQNFLVSADDTKLYMISEPINVSRSAEEIEAELAKQKTAAAEKAKAAMAELNAGINEMPIRGKADAPVTIVEFSDFQCPYCSRGAATVEQALEKYPEDVRFVFMHFPLNFHPWAKPAAIAANCAGSQNHDAFWSLHDAYFKNQKAITPANVVAKSKEFLAGTGIDMDAWSTCAEDKTSETYKTASAAVDSEMALGQKLGVTGTPGFFINGEFLNGAVPLPQMEAAIQRAKEAVTQ